MAEFAAAGPRVVRGWMLGIDDAGAPTFGTFLVWSQHMGNYFLPMAFITGLFGAINVAVGAGPVGPEEFAAVRTGVGIGPAQSYHLLW